MQEVSRGTIFKVLDYQQIVRLCHLSSTAAWTTRLLILLIDFQLFVHVNTHQHLPWSKKLLIYFFSKHADLLQWFLVLIFVLAVQASFYAWEMVINTAELRYKAKTTWTIDKLALLTFNAC